MRRLRAGKPIIAGEVTVIALEEVEIVHLGKKQWLTLYFLKKAIGVVVISPQGQWAMNIKGENVSLERCIQEFEGLQQVMDSL